MGTKRRTLADFNWKLPNLAAASNAKLMFTYVGAVSETTCRCTKILLRERDHKSNDVVVIGYDTQNVVTYQVLLLS